MQLLPRCLSFLNVWLLLNVWPWLLMSLTKIIKEIYDKKFSLQMYHSSEVFFFFNAAYKSGAEREIVGLK